MSTGETGKLAALDGGLVAQVAALFLAAGVPGSLIGVDLVEHGVRLDLERTSSKTKNSASDAKNAVSAMPVDCRYASARSATPRGSRVVGLAGAGVHDGADDDQGLLNAEGVNVRD